MVVKNKNIGKKFQDIEKEMRKEVDDAIAQAKVRNFCCFRFDFVILILNDFTEV